MHKKIKMDEIRFGIVGYGRIGSRHAIQINNNPDAKLVAVCDIKKDRADDAAKKYGCNAHYDLEDMLYEDIDILNICTPSGLHADMSVVGLMNDKHVLCEKPMTLNLVDADQVINAEKRSGKKFFLVKQNRYNPPIKALKDAVYNQKLGDISLINCNVLWNRHKQYYMDDDWKGTMKLDGGSLMTQCSHFLDLMLWIGGPVNSVFSRMENLAHPYIETEDTGFVTINFKNGAIGSLQYTMNVHDKNIEGSMTVIGSKGTIKVGGEYLNTLEKWSVNGFPEPKLEKGAEANDYGTYKGSMSNHDKVIANVVEVLKGKGQIAANSLQGRQSIEAMQAAYISAIEHKEIYLPLKGTHYRFKINEEPPFSGKYKDT